MGRCSSNILWNLEYLTNTPAAVSHQLIHISDWLPTLVHIADVKVYRPIDGHNVWDAVSNDSDSPRNEVLVNVDQLFRICHAFTTSGNIYGPPPQRQV